jgi:hypothetical protein
MVMLPSLVHFLFGNQPDERTVPVGMRSLVAGDFANLSDQKPHSQA